MSNYQREILLVNLSTLPEKGLHLSCPISVESINERMNGASGNDITFIAEPQIDIHISHKHGHYGITGNISFTYEQDCGRCLEAKPLSHHQKFDVVVKLRSPENEEEEDDLGLLYVDEQIIDIEDVAQELIILHISPYFMPECDQTNACTVCHKQVKKQEFSNDNKKGQNLGDLLKRAEENKK